MGVSLSVVVPVFNEFASLPWFVPELVAALNESVPGRRWEVILVDDGSDDRGASFLEQHTGAGEISVVRHQRRFGSGAARKAGSIRAQGEWIAWIDADGTYNPRDLPRLLAVAAGADQVIGARCKEKGRWPALRWGVKRLARLLAGALLKVPIPDLNSGFRLLRRQCLNDWLAELPDGFSCTSTATLAAMRRQQRVCFVPISYRRRLPGSTSKFHPFFDTIRLFRVVLRYGLRESPGGRSSMT